MFFSAIVPLIQDYLLGVGANDTDSSAAPRALCVHVVRSRSFALISICFPSYAALYASYRSAGPDIRVFQFRISPPSEDTTPHIVA